MLYCVDLFGLSSFRLIVFAVLNVTLHCLVCLVFVLLIVFSFDLFGLIGDLGFWVWGAVVFHLCWLFIL